MTQSCPRNSLRRLTLILAWCKTWVHQKMSRILIRFEITGFIVDSAPSLGCMDVTSIIFQSVCTTFIWLLLANKITFLDRFDLAMLWLTIWCSWILNWSTKGTLHDVSLAVEGMEDLPFFASPRTSFILLDIEWVQNLGWIMDIFSDILKLFIDFLQLSDWHVFIATAFPPPF